MLHDLSVPLDGETLPYPGGETGLRHRLFASHEADGFQVTELTMSAHLGTHIDAPLHFLPDGQDAAALNLARFCGPAVCLGLEGPFGPETELDLSETLAAHKTLLRDGDILLLHTGWDALLGAPAYFSCPVLTEQTGALLAAYGIVTLGVDLPTVCRDGRTHRALLDRRLGVVEGLTALAPLVWRRFFFSALPLRLSGCDGSPVRAVALTE